MNAKEMHMGKVLWKDARFHLTGSRYWNMRAPELVKLDANTDVDYVAEYSERIVAELIKMGFKLRDGSNIILDDDGIIQNTGFEQYNNSDGTTKIVLYFESIQVILKTNVAIYLAVQNKIGPEFYVNYLWKRNNSRDKIQATLKHLFELECQDPFAEFDAMLGDYDA